ncbi:MAG: YitT family protein [Clostridia bacterium]|nr:YitT family protein [Clostridia bacterium]
MNFKKLLSDYITITLGAFVLSIAINIFLAPLKISTGGVSGVATVLYYLADVPLSVTVLGLNILLFFLASKKLPKESLVKTLAGVVLLSIFLEATSHIGFYCSDIFIGSVFGGVLSGIGIGFTMRRNASTGGSDFAALIFQKKLPHISPAKIILIIDFIIVSFSGIVFKDYIICFYSLVSLYVCSYIADRILTMGDYAKSVIVVSEKSDEIAGIILSDINRGVTAIYSKGCYKNKAGAMLMSVVKAKELPGLLNKIKEIDPKSFVTITDIKEVRGNGFKRV